MYVVQLYAATDDGGSVLVYVPCCGAMICVYIHEHIYAHVDDVVYMCIYMLLLLMMTRSVYICSMHMCCMLAMA